MLSIDSHGVNRIVCLASAVVICVEMSATAITKDLMSEYYQRVFPTGVVARWLQYGDSGSSYLGRREFCFTLVGDIFTRFRSYPTEAALKADLVKCGPEKIDVGAVYNVTPDKKATIALATVERELVFDIDMSDYDSIRSCCTGKKVCPLCWTWMSTAAHVIHDLMAVDFGFRFIVPVFSGRRGIHIWVLDDEARALTDEERNAIVGYCTVMAEKDTVQILGNLKYNNLHPSLARIHDSIIAPSFERLFLTRTVASPEGGDTIIANPNCIFESPAAARVIYHLLLNVEPHLTQKTRLVGTEIVIDEDAVFSDAVWDACVKRLPPSVLVALHFAAMYPRLDEKVSTRRDHLLKLPFCIHPGTGRLCVPLRWEQLDGFNPQRDPPAIDYLLHETGAIPTPWLTPLTDVLDAMEAARAPRPKPEKAWMTEAGVKPEPVEN